MRSIGARANTFSKLPFPYISCANFKLQQDLFLFPTSTHCKFDWSITACAYHICVGSVGKCTKLQNYENNRNKINCLVLIIPTIYTQIYIYKLILIKLCLTVNQIYDSLFIKHSNFCIHTSTFKFNFKLYTHTHPLNYYKVEQSIMLGGFIYKFPKQKKWNRAFASNRLSSTNFSLASRPVNGPTQKTPIYHKWNTLSRCAILLQGTVVHIRNET